MSRGATDTIDIVTHETGPRPFIALGIPSFGMVHLFFAARLYNLRMPMNTVTRHIYVVGKEIGSARNEIVAKALQVEQDDPSLKCRAVYFLDDDVLVHPDALLKLVSHRRAIVSGLYYTKSSVPTPLVLHGEFNGTAHSWTPGDLVECWAHGMGSTLIDADVFRRMREELALGVDAFGYPQWFKTTRDEVIVKPDGTSAQLGQTEDVYFLRRAAELGYQPAVDTSAQGFAFHFDSRKQVGYPESKWREFMTTGRITWQTESGPIVWEDAA